MKKILWYLPILRKLGINNVLYIVWYRWSLKTGFRKSFFPVRELKLSGDLFISDKTSAPQIPLQSKEQIIENAAKILSGQLKYYSYHWKKVGSPPNWFINPFNGAIIKNPHLHWTELADFDIEIGDIKNVWEASRFYWVISLAQAYALTQSPKYLQTLNAWLKNWTQQNPVNLGPNWKCGQEASIRVFNLINASLILHASEIPNEEFSELIYLHILRISSNIRYAIAQNNNHGTSEAAAIFIGASWLEKYGKGDLRQLPKLKSQGRKWLENRTNILIDTDGSFSQHSVNYHRVVLDTLCYVEFWRQQLKQKAFSKAFYEKASSASQWLAALTDPNTGKAPNLGSNDGALFLNLNSCDYKDYRPSVQLAANLFLNTRIYPEGPYDESLLWLGVIPTQKKSVSNNRQSKVLDNAYVVMHADDSMALIRTPKFNYRPSHNDVFHFDLWHKGVNILCDNGSFSYNPGSECSLDFKSVHMHNTVSFDGQEQMPKLSRFLLAKWIKQGESGEIINTNNETSWRGSYIDYRGNKHFRKVNYSSNRWIIEDRFIGNFKYVQVGFNIPQQIIHNAGNLIQFPWGTVSVKGALNIKIDKGFVSNYYWEKQEINRLVILSDKTNLVNTIIELEG